MTDITENGKYYIPEIEEFHTGFEYESGPGRWNKEIFDVDYFGATYDQYFGSPLEDDIKNGEVRVKYLDHDDIISLGWHKESLCYKIWSDKPSDILTMLPLEKPWYMISSIFLNGRIFHGLIKNKSELKRLMKQLGIQINQQS